MESETFICRLRALQDFSPFLTGSGITPILPKRVNQLSAHVITGISLDIENYCTLRASPSPACQRQYCRFLFALQLKIKGKDCSTINGHDESASIQSLRKDAREVLVRLSDTYILYNRQIGLTGSNRLSLTSCRLDGYTATSYFGWLKAA